MPFYPTLDWTQKAIKETVAIPFPSLEGPGEDPKPPQLEFEESSENQVTDHGNGRWYRDTSYRFNAGGNPHHDKAPDPGDVGILKRSDADKLEAWFLDRYPNDKPQVLKKGAKWNFALVRNQCLFNFHIQVD